MIVQPGFEQETFHTLLEEYFAQAKIDNSLNLFRAKAWDHFLELGMPTRKTEAYRYIKLRNLLSHPFKFTSPLNLDREAIVSAIYPECRQSVLVFVNGRYSPQLSNRKMISPKVAISSLSEASKTFGTFLNNAWAKSLKEESDPFAALNSALHQDGLFMYVPPKTIIEVPVQILHVIQTNLNEPAMLHPRLNLFVGAQSQLNLIASQHLLSNTSTYFVNQVVEAAIEEDAHVQYDQILHHKDPRAWHFDAFRANLKRNATLKSVAVSEGSATVRNDYRVALAGENAEALLNGIWMLANKNESHTHVFIDHQAPHCRSYQLFKGVLNDFSRSSFEGKIMVRQPAQKTEAFQLNNNLILSNNAHADSKPNLEIFADDVKASHGATVGQLDSNQLFYMQTRGFPLHKAKNLLIYGFCQEVLEKIHVNSIRNSLSESARAYLGDHKNS